MLTAVEVAELLGVSPRFVYELHSSGQLPAYRFGPRTVRFSTEDVAAYKATLPKPRGLISATSLRKCEEYRLRIPASERPPSYLTPEQLEIAQRRTRRMRRPLWADPAAIRAIYAEARRLTAETGIPHHVDHIIPLQGDFVTGLHVETNMQILTGRENIRKKNRFEVEAC